MKSLDFKSDINLLTLDTLYSYEELSVYIPVSKCLMSMDVIGAHLAQMSYVLLILFKRGTSSRNNWEPEVPYK